MNRTDMFSILKDIVAELDCQIHFEPLIENVCAIPCGHRIHKDIADQFFGELDPDSWTLKEKKNCPLCTVSVMGYLNEALTGETVKALLELEATIQTLKQKYIEFKNKGLPVNLGNNNVVYESVEKKLTCPVSKELLTEAVCLVPCGHKIQSKSAQANFELLEPEQPNSWKVKEKNCLVCATKVVGYIKDPFIRTLANLFSELDKLRREKIRQNRESLNKLSTNNLNYKPIIKSLKIECEILNEKIFSDKVNNESSLDYFIKSAPEKKYAWGEELPQIINNAFLFNNEISLPYFPIKKPKHNYCEGIGLKVSYDF